MLTLADGRQMQQMMIAGPPRPPAGVERPVVPPEKLRALEAAERGETSLAGSKRLPVPNYQWTFGCSATSAAMIAAYYDRGLYKNLYTGPAGGGVMPMDAGGWGTWSGRTGDPIAPYAQCPLAASRQGLDGRSSRGSIDDYYMTYYSNAPDPYVTGGWTQHVWGDALGDYMKTSQFAHSNPDGSTLFYWWPHSPDRLSCDEILESNIANDGTTGRKQFYEARGYTVTDCYNQPTDNVIAGGFTFSQYKAEIDAGRPVMLNLDGHTVVGMGYDDWNNTVYLYDTWDAVDHTMTWGDSYADMSLQAVSIVNLACPAALNVTSASIGRYGGGQLMVWWGSVADAHHYEFWSATNAPYFAPGADCTNPAPFHCTTVAGPTLSVAGLSSAGNITYTVRAVNNCGGPSAQGSAGVAEFTFALVRP